MTRCAEDTDMSNDRTPISTVTVQGRILAPSTVSAADLVEMRAGLIGLGFTAPQVIARGGSSTVWVAEEETLARKVAIKVLNRNERAAANEALLLAELSSNPAVVEVQRAGTIGSRWPFLVLEDCAGGSMSAYIRDRGPLSPGLAIAICRTIAGALHELHSLDRPRLHLDIKPSNLLITRWGGVKLGDLGSAMDDGNTVAAAFSPAHAAPEQLNRTPVSTATDLYSLTSVLHEFIVGGPPFATSGTPSHKGSAHGTGTNELLELKRTSERPPLDSPRLDAELREFMIRYLDRDPVNRTPASAQDYSDELGRIARRLGIDATAPRLVVLSDTAAVDDMTVELAPDRLTSIRHQKLDGTKGSINPAGRKNRGKTQSWHSKNGPKGVQPAATSTTTTRANQTTGADQTTGSGTSGDQRKGTLVRSAKAAAAVAVLGGLVVTLVTHRSPDRSHLVESALSHPLVDPLAATKNSTTALTPIGHNRVAIEASVQRDGPWIMQVTEWALDPETGIPVRPALSTKAVAEDHADDAGRTTERPSSQSDEVRVFTEGAGTATITINPDVLTCILPFVLEDTTADRSPTNAQCVPTEPPSPRTISADKSPAPSGYEINFELSAANTIQSDQIVEWADGRILRVTPVDSESFSLVGTAATCVSVLSGNAERPIPPLLVGSAPDLAGTAQTEKLCPWKD